MMSDPISIWSRHQSHEARQSASLRRAIIAVLEAHGYMIAMRTIDASLWSVEACCGNRWVTVREEIEDEKTRQKTHSGSDCPRLTITSE
jgi:hypothetical protein